MPGIARKVIICAAIDGLIIQPLSPKGQRPAPALRLRYGDASIAPASREQIPDLSSNPNVSFEAFGVVGLITVAKRSYLITITRRQQVAQILGSPVYVVTEVAITPCTSRFEAETAVSRTATQLQSRTEDTDPEDSDADETLELQANSADDVEDPSAPSEGIAAGSLGPNRNPKSTVAEDVISRRGSYGRFAQRWFSKAGWAQRQRRSIGWSDASPSQSSTAPESERQVSREGTPEATLVQDDEWEQAGEERARSLLPKFLRTAHIFYGLSQSFYFSYDIDITRHWARRFEAPPRDLPLYQQVDPVFFWNRHTLKPFIQTGNDALVLPLMQGFVGQRQFVVDSSPPQHDGDMKDSVELSTISPPVSLPGSPPPERARDSFDFRPTEKKFLVTVISRRSTKRAGLRYLRRGVDDDGYVANAVETEQILSNASWDKSNKIYSFVQIRGSIPLFFTQNPYSLKPAPVIQHSSRANYEACKKHFVRLTKEYGSLQIVNLVEKHNVEAPLGSEFQNTVAKLNEDVFAAQSSEIPFEWFDFHAACRGMKFENVSILLNMMREKLEELGWSVEKDGELVQRQRGVLRTNCMDCLDRTNVCQSSFAKQVLEDQLRAEGYDMSAQLDQETTWFNTLWADNGDAVSKQYASTAAMKGDFTRTRKRNYRGTLNDLGLSLTRFYNGMVNDYFSQAAIDFLLGNVTSMVFQEFEAEMMTKDPAISMIKRREQAIELCQKRVVSDENEEFTGGWVLLTPPTSNTTKSQLPFEEVVLLLTDAALYLCRFDWNLDKVSSFERVDLAHIVGIQFGTYITSTIAPVHTDETKNVGFVVSYQPGKNDIRRINTRTVSSNFLSRSGTTSERKSGEGDEPLQKPAPPASGLASLLSPRRTRDARPVRKLAFKAPYSQSSAAVGGDGPRLSEIQQVVTICADIERLAFKCQPGKDAPGTSSVIEKGDIISLEEARQSTTLLDHLSHSIKKLVWA
ncbi:hypothetical protein SODALDRAFT_270662 [Sodiomyces alkalinus F11]|uniref:SacI domain-containing protein n=1 Tax=Sodiomyces alkalinus (strain CBS 110278 / VKM F-3762 / F11) TaxID=1314773 RepID=A0A3N2Q4A5_SODAK|nr:hypothetical protein SODALDRAFT_270662 [Sodiomyces alkalinus F11]ROT41537.1 hypothetical protein SODALDRAFT_270662 [Sodiomyces alkalinus F11]